MTVADCLRQLRAGDIPLLDGELLLAHALQCERSWLLAHDDYVLKEKSYRTFLHYWKRWRRGVPLAYITGIKEFYGLQIQVDERVLIPRPESEMLVDIALEYRHPASVIDLGTGSGALAVCLAHRRCDWRCLATDVSEQALQVARANIEKWKLSARVATIPSDWWQQVEKQQFDIILSNPPYIARGDENLDIKSKKHEPEQALYADANGLQAYERIFAGASAYCAAHTQIIVEHGFSQRKQVQQLARKYGLQVTGAHRDMAGLERVMTLRKAR